MARMLLLAALPAALGLVAPTRHLSRAPALHATNADWRSKCDSDGVVSYYDYGVRLGGAAAAPAAAPAADGFEVTMSGLKFKDEVVGTGESPEKGNVVKVQYTGWLAASDFKFDSSRDRNMPFSFTIGDGNVIPGWDEGVSTMKVGGRRTLLIPPRLAYGDQNIGEGLIPPNSELKFDVELIEVKAGALAGITEGLEGSVGGLLGNFGANPFTFFAVLLVLVTVAPAFLPDDNPLMKGGNPFEGMGN